MNFKTIKAHIRKNDYLFSDHADEERTKDELSVKDIEEAILAGKVIAERLDDPRGESRLISGQSKKGTIIHIVIGLRFGKPVIVTNYLPGEDEWIHGTIRKRRKYE